MRRQPRGSVDAPFILRVLREGAGPGGTVLPREALAELADLEPARIARLETSPAVVRVLLDLDRFAEALGLDLAEAIKRARAAWARHVS